MDGFAEGASLACDGFFNTDNRKLYAKGDQNEWSIEECEGADSDDPTMASYSEIPTERPPGGSAQQAGRDAGIENACNAIFDVAGVDEFYWGTETFTVDDCFGASGFYSKP